MENNNFDDKNSFQQEYPVKFEVVYPDHSSRLLALSGILCFFPKGLLLFPHLIILWFLHLASGVAVLFGFWAILFTGRYPRSLFDFNVGVARWQNRANAWMLGLTDKYPPFSLS